MMPWQMAAEIGRLKGVIDGLERINRSLMYQTEQQGLRFVSDLASERLRTDAAESRYLEAEHRYLELAKARTAPPPAPPTAKVEEAPRDVQSAVMSALSIETKQRMADSILSDAVAKGLAMTYDQALEHAAMICDYAEQNDPIPL